MILYPLTDNSIFEATWAELGAIGAEDACLFSPRLMMRYPIFSTSSRTLVILCNIFVYSFGFVFFVVCLGVLGWDSGTMGGKCNYGVLYIASFFKVSLFSVRLSSMMVMHIFNIEKVVWDWAY